MSGQVVDDRDLDVYRTELDVSGARRVYVGDPHVWIWYRGTGVGPFPCMSALQALERVCDQLIEIDLPIANIVYSIRTSLTPSPGTRSSGASSTRTVDWPHRPKESSRPSGDIGHFAKPRCS
jgi:hypothetical protein